MSIKPLLLASAITYVLVACLPSSTPSATVEGVEVVQLPAETEKAKDKPSFAVPKPVEAFEMYCYRTNAEYERVVDIAELMKLPQVPKKFDAIIGPMVGGGKGFVIVNSSENRRMVLLGASDQGACSIFSMGYDETAIRDSLMENYKLKEVARDDTGLQVNEMFIPNGVKGTVGEGSEHGLVGITTAKAGDAGITVSFVSPEAAKRTFEANR